jgi:hypothetical protein
MSDADENRQRYLRAKELLDGLDWLFDGFIAAEMKKIYDSNIHDPKTREEAYRRAKVAGELKGCLMQRVDDYENEQTVLKHKEAKNGHREQPLN